MTDLHGSWLPGEGLPLWILYSKSLTKAKHTPPCKYWTCCLGGRRGQCVYLGGGVVYFCVFLHSPTIAHAALCVKASLVEHTPQSQKTTPVWRADLIYAHILTGKMKTMTNYPRMFTNPWAGGWWWFFCINSETAFTKDRLTATSSEFQSVSISERVVGLLKRINA